MPYMDRAMYCEAALVTAAIGRGERSIELLYQTYTPRVKYRREAFIGKFCYARAFLYNRLYILPISALSARAARAVRKLLPLLLGHEGQKLFAEHLGVLAGLDAGYALDDYHLVEDLLAVPDSQVVGDGAEDHVGQDTSVEGGEQGHAHVRADIAVAGSGVHVFKHVDKTH